MSWSFLDFTGLSHFFSKLPEKLVTTSTTQTISGTKSFSSTILGSVSGSAASAAKDGAGNIIADTYETKADAATHLSKSDAAGTYLSKSDAASGYVQTGAVDQTIGGTKTFSKPIAGSVTGSSGSCTGNAATATRANSAASADTATNANYANSAGSVAWSNVTGKPTIPTNTNQLTNGAGFITSSGSCNYANSAGIAPSSDSVKGRGWLPNGVDMTTLTSGSYQCSPNNLPSQGVPYGTSPYGELLIACGSQYTSIIYIDVFGNSACWSSNQQVWVINVHSGNIGSQSVNYANSAGYADSAGSAIKLATARTIALSGAATGTATGFDGSGNITIPVTALAASAIRAQWYAAYPDGAEAHNAMWGGRDITAAFDNGTVSANIANGTFKDIFPGDYITKQITVPQILKADDTTEYIAQTVYNVRFVIADLDVWLNRGDAATTAHHVAIVPQSVVFNSCMNETNVTTGGYLGSFMNTNVMPAFATGLQNAFGSAHILQFRFLDTKAVNNDLKSGGIVNYTGATYWGGHDWTSHYCHLMTETMVYGAPITASCAADEIMGGVQFAAFRLNNGLVYNRQNYWLGDVVSSASFALVSGYGYADANYASYVIGVRPFALLR